MEKLIELLKEYIENYGNDVKVREEENYILDTWIEFVYWNRVYLYETIISKKFWFIKWLVENEKIDLDEFSIIDGFDDYESLLMRLAIDDEPLEFLASILK